MMHRGSGAGGSRRAGRGARTALLGTAVLAMVAVAAVPPSAEARSGPATAAHGAAATPVSDHLDAAVTQDPDTGPSGRVLVRWRDGVGAAERATVLAAQVPELLGPPVAIGRQLDALRVGADHAAAVTVRLAAVDAVAIVERDQVLRYPQQVAAVVETISTAAEESDDPAPEGSDETAIEEPDDPLFGEQWGLANTGETIGDDTSPIFTLAGFDVRLLPAWTVTRGDPSVVVGIIDAPIDATHPDLQGAVIDEVSSVLDGAPASSLHGTAVASVLAARADDGIGMVGVAPEVSLLSIAAFRSGPDGADSSTMADVLRAFELARSAEVDVINASWVSTQGSELLRAAVADAGVPVVAASGNDFRVLQPGDEVFPAAYDLPNLVTVTAVDPTGRVPGFANIGPEVVDVGAPGVSVLAALTDGDYVYVDGTSFAAPHVTGALALARSVAPYATARDLVDAVTWTSHPIASLLPATRSGGMLDVAALVRGVQRPVCRQDRVVTADFADVSATNPHRRGIDCIAAAQVASGRDDATYAPAASITREQAASFLAAMVRRAGDVPLVEAAGFTDVDPAGSHAASIDLLAHFDLVRGGTDDRFRPREPVTRGQFASLLVATHDLLTGQQLAPSRAWFGDTDGSVHARSIDRARDLGLIRGVDRVTFAPGETVRRDQLATMLAGGLDALAREGVELR